MNKFSTILTFVLAIAVAVLFYFQFKKPTNIASNGVVAKNNAGKIAFFEMDSLQNNYDYYKQVIKELTDHEQNIRSLLINKKKALGDKLKYYQGQQKTMTPDQYNAASAELGQMEKELQAEEQSQTSQLSQETRDKLGNVKKKVEDFLKEYNATYQYDYIISNSMNNDFIFYKDSTLNITNDLIKGLNEKYKKEKKN
jgi:outer membrane protein